MIITGILGAGILTTLVIIAIFVLGILSLFMKWFKKAIHGRALVRTGSGGTQITFEKGLWVIPIFHRIEIMDITLKTITIERLGNDGLICKDNMRADIKVAFFIRVNRTVDDVRNVALSIGCQRASVQETLITLFDAKFSEALKTVGKRFDFVDLYNSREEFKHEIIQIIGKDLNGYVLDDCAIDYLEQTPLSFLKSDNILDSEGIKKITELTANQIVKANLITRDKEKTIVKQDVEARETILELNKQLAEKEQQQKREIANITDREVAETKKVSQEQRLIAEQARIETDETIAISEQNKDRQILVATRNKERVDGVEQEKVTQDRELQVNERERIVSLAQIEKEKAVENERKNVQEVIRERVIVEKAVVTEEEKIKDTKAFAEADRKKKVSITQAEMLAEQSLVRQIKSAEAERKSAEFKAQQKVIEAKAQFEASDKEAEAIKILAEAEAAQASALGKSEAQVIEAKAFAIKQQGETEASIIEMKALAEAKGVQAMATAEAKEISLKGGAEADVIEQKGLKEASVIAAKAESSKLKGLAEAEVIEQKLFAEAKGIDQKAVAMKKLDGVGKEHEEFKLKLNKEKEVELAQINIQEAIAQAQANVIGEALKSAKIDIVGGETMFFDKIIGSITQGKAIDKVVDNSLVLSSIKEQFLDTEDGENFKTKIKNFITQFGVSSNDIKNLSVSALLMRLAKTKKGKQSQNLIEEMLDLAISKGIHEQKVSELV